MDEILTRPLFRDVYFQTIKKKNDNGILSIYKFQTGGEVFTEGEKKALFALPFIKSLAEATTRSGETNVSSLIRSLGQGAADIAPLLIDMKKLEIASRPKAVEQVRTLSSQEIADAGLPTGTIAQIDSTGKINIVSKPSDKQLEETENVVSTLSTLNRLKKDYVELGKPVGPFYNLDPQKIGGFFSGLVGGEYGKNIQAFKATNADLSAKYKKAISGAAVSEPEAKRLEAVIPDPSDTEAVYEGKIRAMDDYLNTVLKIKESQGLVDIKQAYGALEKSGVSINNFYKPNEAIDRYKFVDGEMIKIK